MDREILHQCGCGDSAHVIRDLDQQAVVHFRTGVNALEVSLICVTPSTVWIAINGDGTNVGLRMECANRVGLRRFLVVFD